jgi:hypothetical protein
MKQDGGRGEGRPFIPPADLRGILAYSCKISVETGKGLRYPDEAKGFRAIFDDRPTLQIVLVKGFERLPFYGI